MTAKASMYRLLRRLLGRRLTFALRNALSTIYLALMGRVDYGGKEKGVSAIVCTYNEEDWVDLSLLSVSSVVDEFIVVDSSTDRTPYIVKEVAETHGLKVKLYRVPPGDLAYARNTALAKASYRWILVWDADFIASRRLIGFIKNVVEEFDGRGYFLVYWPFIKLCGDIHHVCSPAHLHTEHWLYTYHPKARYEYMGVLEALITPVYAYRVIYHREPLGWHLALVRRPERLAIKILWWRFKREAEEYARKHGDYTPFIRQVARKLYGTDDLKEVGRLLIREIIKNAKPYDENKYGPLPEAVAKRMQELLT